MISSLVNFWLFSTNFLLHDDDDDDDVYDDYVVDDDDDDAAAVDDNVVDDVEDDEKLAAVLQYSLSHDGHEQQVVYLIGCHSGGNIKPDVWCTVFCRLNVSMFLKN